MPQNGHYEMRKPSVTYFTLGLLWVDPLMHAGSIVYRYCRSATFKEDEVNPILWLWNLKFPVWHEFVYR